MMTLTLDLRFVLRSLARRPLFAILSVLTLALGLGANTVIFSVVDAVLFRPLPFPEPERLVRVWPESYFSKEELLALRERSASYEGIAGYFSWAVYGLTGGDEPEALRAAHASAELFSVLGVPAALGQTFQPGQNIDGQERIVVLSHGLWQRRFGSDPKIVGRSLALDGASYTVIGVMPAGFRFPLSETEIWVPMRFDPGNEVDFKSSYVQLIGRLAPGVTPLAAQAEGRAAAASMRQAFGYPHDYGTQSTVQSLHRVLVGDVRPAMLTLLGAVGLVLLIAAANVANLLLTRAAGRSREVAVRAALGAGRGRLVRLLLTESLLLSFLGGAAGLLAAVLGLDAVVALLPADLPRLHEVAVDGRLFGFALGLALATGLLFGLAPAFKAARPDLFDSLRESAGGTDRQGRSRLSGLLVVSEVALALMLVIGAGLLAKSFWRLTRVDPGFEPRSVLSFYPILPGAEYDDYDREKAFYLQVLERLEALPGVESAGGVHMLPVGSWGFNGSFESEDHPLEAGASPPIVNWRVVTPAYFDTLGIPLLRGRALTDADRDGTPGVALVNRALAQRFWPEESPVGKRIRHSLDGGEEVTVVGVVGDVRQHGLGSEVAPEIYRPLRQNQRPAGINFVLRATSEPEPLFAAARAAVWSIDPDVPVGGMRTMEQVIHRSVAQPRLVMLLVTLFAAVAMVLGAIGIYGVMANDVSRRTRELGLRMALGARRREILALVLKRGMVLVAAGLGVGLVAALGLSRFLSSQLFEVQPVDLPLYLVVALVLSAVAAVATLVPARRATAIDPLQALRHE